MSTQTTAARAAPEDNPKSITAVAIATSKWFEAPIIASKKRIRFKEKSAWPYEDAAEETGADCKIQNQVLMNFLRQKYAYDCRTWGPDSS